MRDLKLHGLPRDYVGQHEEPEDRLGVMGGGGLLFFGRHCHTSKEIQGNHRALFDWLIAQEFNCVVVRGDRIFARAPTTYILSKLDQFRRTKGTARGLRRSARSIGDFFGVTTQFQDVNDRRSASLVDRLEMCLLDFSDFPCGSVPHIRH
ncbi:MAG: hypothetical protein KGO02_21015 [Alphaproteobacteria bacterium]|nr:hypothetical protein [Alphaproteobacteria bacterium]